MSIFTPEEISALDTGGNAVAARTWLAKWKPEGGSSRPISKNIVQVDSWIQTVFMDKRYFSSTPFAPAAALARVGDTEQIPVRPLSEVLGGVPGSVRLTVSPSPSMASSPPLPSPSPLVPESRPPPPAAPRLPAAAAVQPHPGHTTGSAVVTTRHPPSPQRPAPQTTAFAAPAAAYAAAVGGTSPAPLGFTDNAFGPPTPAPAAAATAASPSRSPASSPVQMASTSGGSSFDPFGSFISAPAISTATVEAGAPSAAVPAAATAAWPGGPCTAAPQEQGRSPSAGGAAPTVGTSNRVSGGGLGLPPAPAQRVSSSATAPPSATTKEASTTAAAWPSNRGAGFSDDADWGAFAGATPAVAAADASPPQPAAHPPSPSRSSSSHSPPHQQQQHRQPMPQHPQAISRGPSGGGAGAAASTAPPSQHNPRAELPSDLFSEPVLPPVGIGMGMGMGMGVGGFRPLMGVQPPPTGMLLPGQPPLAFQGPGRLPGAGVGPLPFPAQHPAALPPGIGIGAGMASPPRVVGLGGVPAMALAPQPLMGAFAYAPQPGLIPPGLVPPAGAGFVGGALAQGTGAFSFGEMGAALPQGSPSGQVPQQMRVSGGNPFA